MFNLYILYSDSADKYYVGYTNDLERHLLEHNRKKGKYTDGGIPWRLVHREEFESKHEAMNREKSIKSNVSNRILPNWAKWSEN